MAFEKEIIFGEVKKVVKKVKTQKMCRLIFPFEF
jgi:hypothetical protein